MTQHKYSTLAQMLDDLGEAKTAERLALDVQECLKKEAALLEEEQGLNSQVNFSFWTKLPTWTKEEAVALTLGLNPEYINNDAISHFPSGLVSYSIPVQLYKKLYDMLNRSINAGEIKGFKNNHLPYKEYIRWLKRNAVPIPEGMDIKKAGRPKGRVEHDDSLAIERVINRMKDERITRNKAISKEISEYGVLGASEPSYRKRLSDKCRDKLEKK